MDNSKTPQTDKIAEEVQAEISEGLATGQLTATKLIKAFNRLAENARQLELALGNAIQEQVPPGTSPKARVPAKREVSVEFLLAVTELLFQIEIGTFVDEHGHKAQMLAAYKRVRETRPI